MEGMKARRAFLVRFGKGESTTLYSTPEVDRFLEERRMVGDKGAYAVMTYEEVEK